MIGQRNLITKEMDMVEVFCNEMRELNKSLSETSKYVKEKDNLRKSIASFNIEFNRKCIFSPVYIQQKLKQYYNMQRSVYAELISTEFTAYTEALVRNEPESKYVILTENGYPTLGICTTTLISDTNQNMGRIKPKYIGSDGLVYSNYRTNYFIEYKITTINTNIPFIWFVSSESRMDGMLKEHPEFFQSARIENLQSVEYTTPGYINLLKVWEKVKEHEVAYKEERENWIKAMINHIYGRPGATGVLAYQGDTISISDVFLSSFLYDTDYNLSIWHNNQVLAVR